MNLFLKQVHGPQDDDEVDDVANERIQGREESNFAPDLDPAEVVTSGPDISLELHLEFKPAIDEKKSQSG